MRRLLGRYYAIARHCIEQNGGTVEKFIGDAKKLGDSNYVDRFSTQILEKGPLLRAAPGLSLDHGYEMTQPPAPALKALLHSDCTA